MTHVDGPIEWKRHLVKHSDIPPLTAFVSPEQRMRNLLFHLPTPIFIAPKLALFIASGGHKFQILAIRYFVFIDGEAGHLVGVKFKFVVPTKSLRVLRESQRNNPGRNSNGVGLNR